jgi:hypothetical protein
MESDILKILLNAGGLGAVVVVLFAINARLYKDLSGKMFTVIENNTKAFTEVKSVIDKCGRNHSRKDD